MKIKLPIIVGIIYTLSSLPFIFGLLTPSIHEGNIYSVLYVFINMPVIFLFGSIIDEIVQIVFNEPSLYNSNIIFIIISIIFWVAVSFVIGLFIDKKNGRNN
jgi:hypothetical protein